MTHAGMAALLLWRAQAPLATAWWLVLLAGAAGALLSLPLTIAVARMTDAIARLPGASFNPVPAIWPLRHLIQRFNNLGRDIAAVRKYRDQLLEQIRETAAQEERNRLARDLHDSVKQELFLINVSAATAQARWDDDPEGAKAALHDVRDASKKALAEMQAMLQQLNPQPLNTVSLVSAVKELCQALAYQTGAEVRVEIGRLPDDAFLPLGAADQLWRIAQEALANVGKHARATAVGVWLKTERSGDNSFLWLRILDNGQGFVPDGAAGGMGLHNIRHRVSELGADLSLDSSPAHGTEISVRVPLSAAPPVPTQPFTPRAPAPIPPPPAVATGRRYAIVYLLPLLLVATTGNYLMTGLLLLLGYDFMSWRSIARRFILFNRPESDALAYLQRWSRWRASIYFLCMVGAPFLLQWNWWRPNVWILAAVLVFFSTLAYTEVQTIYAALRRPLPGPWRRLDGTIFWILSLVVGIGHVVAGVQAADGLRPWLVTNPLLHTAIVITLGALGVQRLLLWQTPTLLDRLRGFIPAWRT